MEKGTIFSQMEIMQNVACHWISLMSPVNLDIFMGFPNENDAINYFKEKSDNTPVYACEYFYISKYLTLNPV